MILLDIILTIIGMATVGLCFYLIGGWNEQRKALKRASSLLQRWTEMWMKYMHSFKDPDSAMAFHDFVIEMDEIIRDQVHEIK